MNDFKFKDFGSKFMQNGVAERLLFVKFKRIFRQTNQIK
ncbi:hypothetical protein CAMSH0001_0485 [Campylobacter showae RM3277]|uniref:Uncharacterized protein n=1 Tax=Campylobacter showae RM3277 TaxID=553219 RepID=C6RFI0_9BACT|nr:hypothetical protein CAMSH0001_0485 [Campylobacter showae RM3277]